MMASIGPRGAAIVAQVEVGAELYRWLVAREILVGLSNELVYELVSPLIRQKFEAHLAVTDLGAGNPTAVLVGPLARGSAFVPQSGRFEDLPVVESVNYRIDENQVNGSPVVVAQAAIGRISSGTPLSEIFERPNNRSGPRWIRAEVHVDRWADRLERSGKLFVTLQKLYDFWIHKKLLAQAGVMGPRLYRKTLLSSEFKSIDPKVDDAASWSAKLQVGPKGDAVVADLEVGAELYDWFVARQILAEVRARRRP